MDAEEKPGRITTSPPAGGGVAQGAGVVGDESRFTKFSALAAILLGLLCVAPVAQARGDAPGKPVMREIAAVELPAEARRTIALIHKGGPFPYERDGAAFSNFEKRLPVKGRGYYQEFTVRTPGANNRGARRIVAGKGGELYYTDDHYLSFRRVREP